MTLLMSKDYVGLKISQKKRWSILGAITSSVTQQVSKVQNKKCFKSVLLSFLKCLLMAATRDKTVG